MTAGRPANAKYIATTDVMGRPVYACWRVYRTRGGYVSFAHEADARAFYETDGQRMDYHTVTVMATRDEDGGAS